MTEKKTSFVLPTDCIEDLEDFSNAEAGELFRAILAYVNEQQEPDFSDRAMKMFFKRIKKYIDNANENYEKICQARKEAGAKGGKSKTKQTKQMLFEESKTSKCFFNEAKQANATDTESDTESDTDTESDFKESTRESTPPSKKKYGESGNVMLTDNEYERLAEQMGVSKRDEYIEKLSDYMASTGKIYKSHYATIRNWFRGDGGKKASPSFDVEKFAEKGNRLPVYSGGQK